MFDQEKTLWVGGLDPRVEEDILWELMSHAGPVLNLKIPNRVFLEKYNESFLQSLDDSFLNYAFIEFNTVEDCVYAQKLLNNIRLYSKPICCTRSSYIEEKRLIHKVKIGPSEELQDNESFQQVLAKFGKNTIVSKNHEFLVIGFFDEEAANKCVEVLDKNFLLGNILDVRRI